MARVVWKTSRAEFNLLHRNMAKTLGKSSSYGRREVL
jgi:hypothetical protein